MRKAQIRDIIGKYINLNLTHFSAMACYFTYITAFMIKCGLSSTQIGIVMTVNSIISILMQPFWGFLCDRLHSVRKVYAGLMMVLSITVPCVTMLRGYGSFLLWIPCLITLFYCPASPLLDSWITQGIKKTPAKSYGSIRLWGTISYLIVVSAMGRISDIFRMEIIFFCFSGFALMNSLISLSIRDEGVPDIKPENNKNTRLKDIPVGKLLKNYNYISFVLCAFLLQIPTALRHNFLPQRVYYIGGSDTLYGLLISASAVSEIPVFFFSSKLIMKYKTERILIFSMIAYFLHLCILTFNIPVWSIIPVQMLQGIGYSAFVVSSISYIDSLSPVDLKTSAMTFAAAVYSGASGIIGNLLAGYIIDSTGIINAFRYGSIISGLAVLLFFFLCYKGRNKSLKAIN